MPDHQPLDGSPLGRRAFLRAGLALPLAGAAVSARFREATVRTFEIHVELDLGAARGEARAWLPLR